MSRQDDTPLMQQWRQAKARHADALVFFRVGDFYELFHDDAKEGARLLGLTLTTRNNGGAADVPMAGVPARAKDEYIRKLVKLGRRVAICDQVEDPAEAKGIVRREVVETITPGAVLSDTLLSEKRNNYLVAVARDEEGKIGLAAADVSTGELVAVAATDASIEAELARFEPAELLLPERWSAPSGRGDRVVEAAIDTAAPGASRTYRPDWLFDPEIARSELARRFRVHGLEGFGFESGDGALLGALGALVAYLTEVQPAAAAELRPPRVERPGRTMVLDEMTRRNLELLEPLRPGEGGVRSATLIDVLDATLTAMGARLLRKWLLAPLVDAAEIWRRQDAVAVLVEDPALRRRVRAELGEIRDLERLASKVATGRITPREMRALGDSLARLPALARALADGASGPVSACVGEIDVLADVRELIAAALAESPPATLAEGGVIRPGYDATLDELRDARDGARDFIARLQAKERERTGIASLKVGYNRVFGYYIEVTRANADRVPDDYQRRQTLANAERYVTPELKEWEERVLGAEERILALEAELFGELRARVAEHAPRLYATAGAVAALDVLAAFAHLAVERDYVRPEVHTGFELRIEEGRHPVVETMMPREVFIPNDVVLDEEERVMILTGPNMAGKSTLLRQVGLIQLMAQIGSFVPAARARLPVVDRIFTRVGASDNLVRGQSTFMVEMSETAAILSTATRSSLVLLDEIGRGTATYDGVSIAWAVTEHLHDRIGAKTIFATHYHELTQLADLLPGVFNANVVVRETGDDIVFLRRLERGGADRSYGIQVARLAGLPASVVARAKHILRELEGSHAPRSHAWVTDGRARLVAEQLTIFDAYASPVLEKLRAVRVETMTPLEALNLLAELQREAGG